MTSPRFNLQVAEKRKSLLDELAIKYQTAADTHRERVKTLEAAHAHEVEQLTGKAQELEVSN